MHTDSHVLTVYPEGPSEPSKLAMSDDERENLPCRCDVCGTTVYGCHISYYPVEVSPYHVAIGSKPGLLALLNKRSQKEENVDFVVECCGRQFFDDTRVKVFMQCSVLQCKLRELERGSLRS